jgi:hypothetical protein
VYALVSPYACHESWVAGLAQQQYTYGRRVSQARPRTPQSVGFCICSIVSTNQSPRSRRANGATQTFRRPSVAPSSANSAHQRDGSASQPRTSTDSPGVYVPPHLSASRNGTASEHRYSKDQLLQLFKAQYESENDTEALSSLYVGGWEPNITNGNSSASWGRRDEPKDTHGADLCWDRSAQMVPLGLNPLSEDEKDVSFVMHMLYCNC